MSTIAERELSRRDDAGQDQAFKVKIETPRQDGAAWACDYEIGAPADFRATAYGEDSLQALAMALQAVDAHLKAPDLKDRVTWLGAPHTTVLG